MAKKEFAVFGLGEFGSSIAIALEENGCQVLAVDSNQEKVQEISAYVTHAACANVADQAVVRSLGIHNMDGVIVGIGENLELLLHSRDKGRSRLGVPVTGHDEWLVVLGSRVGNDGGRFVALLFIERQVGAGKDVVVKLGNEQGACL